VKTLRSERSLIAAGRDSVGDLRPSLFTIGVRGFPKQ
jgi:hypothetical protein